MPPSPPVGGGEGADLLAATYASAAMGTGLGWTDEERVALSRAYLSTSLDAVKGSDQTETTFWAEVVAEWKCLLAGRPGARRRTERGVGGVQKQWDKVRMLQRSGDRGWGTTVKWLSGFSLCVCVRTRA